MSFSYYSATHIHKTLNLIMEHFSSYSLIKADTF